MGQGLNGNWKNIPPHIRNIYRKHGTNPPMHVTDGDGKVLYTDSDVVKLAKWSASKGGPASDFEIPKLKNAGILLKCSFCGKEEERFFHQVFGGGFYCYNCNEKNNGIKFPSDEKLAEKILNCQELMTSFEQTKALNEILKDYLENYKGKEEK